jgi:tRNA/tmRNA/rRNA uracil-C5-methylase (TrmA/RlmC/RlmD family)
MPNRQEFTYSYTVSETLGKSSMAAYGSRVPVEPLAYLQYDKELEVKNDALFKFWEKNRLHGTPGIVTGSPKPRHYRTTTKRRIFFSHGKYRLRFSHHKEADAESLMLCSELEPVQHEQIYSFLAEKINNPAFSASAKALTYIIIRGTYSEFSVIFNVTTLNGQIVHNLKALAENVEKLGMNIVSCFIFHDPTRSDYYLDNRNSDCNLKVKKLFGPDIIKLKVNGLSYQFEPVSFSQINQSMLPLMLDSVNRLCGNAVSSRFIDLYCGYGLFANYVGRKFIDVYGIDYDETSVNRARATARYIIVKDKLETKMHFRAAPITAASLSKLLPPADSHKETILLDPPRQGAIKGVIPFCAQRKPSRIIHVFCNIDRIPADIMEWQRYGYRINDVVALDMFPGTPALEIMILLKPF